MPKVNIKYRFEDPNGSLLKQAVKSIDVPYNTQASHVFGPQSVDGYVTPKPQKHLVAPGHVPSLVFTYREKSAAAITIRFINQNGKLINEQELDLAVGKKVNPVKACKVPKGYHLIPKQDKTVTADRFPHTVTLKIEGDIRTKAVTLILDLQTPSGHTIQNVTHKVSERLRTGDEYKVDPINYTPKGYHSLNGVETGYLGVDGLTKPDITFSYCAMPAAPVNVTYVNQRRRRVGSYTYSGYMHERINIMNPNHVPAGYHLLENGAKVVILEPTIQSVTVNVTGNEEDAHATAELIYQQPDGDVVNDISKQIPLSGLVGDMYEIDPNQWIRPGYHAISYTVNGYFMPGGAISSSHCVFKYEAGSASLFGVTYVNQKDQIISTQELHGYVDQPINLEKAVPVPEGYHLVSGQKLEYKCSLKPKQVKLHVQGEFQTNDFNMVKVIENASGKQLTHRLVGIPVKKSVGDNYVIDPAKHPVAGYVPVSDPLTGVVRNHTLSVPAHRFIYRPQPVHTKVDYLDAKKTIVKSVPVNSYLDERLDVSDNGNFNRKHMPEGYQYLEVPTNPRMITLQPGMKHIVVKIAPIAPEQAQITHSPLYPSFVIDWGRWHYVKKGSKTWHNIVAGNRISQHLVFHPIDIQTFSKNMKVLFFINGFSKLNP